MSYAHLPNAPHIDRVLAHAKNHPEKWDAARAVARAVAWDAAWDAAWSAGRDAAWCAGRDAAWGAAWSAAWGGDLGDARGDTQDVVAALVAWDDASVFLDQDPDVLRMAAAAGNHAAVLMLPAVIAMSNR
jgi:hypothetical protein